MEFLTIGASWAKFYEVFRKFAFAKTIFTIRKATFPVRKMTIV